MAKKDIRLAWKKDKFDPRDYIHQLKLEKIPASFSLAQYCPVVRDQGNVGACTGFGIGGQLTGLAKQVNAYKEWFSPEWIYNGARFIEGTLTQDAGAEPGDCYSWIKKMGCLLEEYWPYNPNAVDTTSPPSTDNQYATQWPILTYVRVTGGSAGICSAIAAGNLVAIGTPWFSSWMDTDSSGKLANVTTSSPIAGGHETFLFGYDQTTKYFSGQNSWSADWGLKGTYLMPFAPFDGTFNVLGGYDAYYVTVSWGTSPSPPPPPPPSPPPPTPTQKLIRMDESPDAGKTWKTLYSGAVLLGAKTDKATTKYVRVEESVDSGKTWKRLYQGRLL